MHVCVCIERKKNLVGISYWIWVYVSVCIYACVWVSNRRKISYAPHIECGFMCVGVYMHVCMYVCIQPTKNIVCISYWVWVYVCGCVCACVYVCIRRKKHKVGISLSVGYMCVWVWVWVCMCVCVYGTWETYSRYLVLNVGTYVCKYIHTRICMQAEILLFS
jgi:hypothetical protein